MLEGKPLDSFQEADIQALQTAQVPESRTLEYKRELNIGTDSEKKEFLADISAFANAQGGHLVIGVEETNGVPAGIPGVAVTDADALKLQLSQIAESGIAPRIPNLGIHVVALSSGDSVILIRIPRSWMSPHMVWFQQTSKFYSRNSAGKFQLDATDIRQAFLLSETALEQVRNFRLERLGRILGDDTVISMTDPRKLVLHSTPLSLSNPEARVNLDLIAANDHQEVRALLYRIGNRNVAKRYNFDGIVYHPLPSRDDPPPRWYMQVYTNGCVEYVSTLERDPVGEALNSRRIEAHILNTLAIMVEVQRCLEIVPPSFIMVSLLGVRGMVLDAEQQSWQGHAIHPIDRDQLIVPETMLNSFKWHPPETMHFTLNTIWNAAGWPRSMNYDDEGQYTPDQENRAT